MSDLEVPWAIHHSEHSARLARVDAQQKLGTGSGVSRPGDLKVRPLNVPGNGFRVAPGGGTAQSRDTDASARESYGPLLGAELVVTDVPGTGSGETRRDLVILEITDPAMQSVTYDAPEDPEYTGGWLVGDNFNRITVIPNVGASVTSLDQITTGDYAHVTGITLAAINWPESTGTITSAMIEDLRVLKNPRSERILRSVDLNEEKVLTSTTGYPDGQVFPTELTGGEALITIPEWATHVRVVATWASVRFPAGTNALGNFWVQISSNADPDRIVTPLGSFDAPGVGNQFRESWTKGATVAVPAAKRGKTHNIFPKARLDAALPVGERPYMNSQSSMILDLEFFEAVA